MMNEEEEEVSPSVITLPLLEESLKFQKCLERRVHLECCSYVSVIGFRGSGQLQFVKSELLMRHLENNILVIRTFDHLDEYDFGFGKIIKSIHKVRSAAASEDETTPPLRRPLIIVVDCCREEGVSLNLRELECLSTVLQLTLKWNRKTSSPLIVLADIEDIQTIQLGRTKPDSLTITRVCKNSEFDPLLMSSVDVVQVSDPRVSTERRKHIYCSELTLGGTPSLFTRDEKVRLADKMASLSIGMTHPDITSVVNRLIIDRLKKSSAAAPQVDPQKEDAYFLKVIESQSSSSSPEQNTPLLQQDSCFVNVPTALRPFITEFDVYLYPPQHRPAILNVIDENGDTVCGWKSIAGRDQQILQLEKITTTGCLLNSPHTEESGTSGLLIHGPEGKSYFATCFIESLKRSYVKINPSTIMESVVGGIDMKFAGFRELLMSVPQIVFLFEDIDTLLDNSQIQKGLADLFYEANSRRKNPESSSLIIATCQNISLIPQRWTQNHHFGTVVELTSLDERIRNQDDQCLQDLLHLYGRGRKCESLLTNIETVRQLLVDTGAVLSASRVAALIRDSAINCIKRTAAARDIENLQITVEDVEATLKSQR